VRELGEERAVLIAGPTASGKSSLAIKLAKQAEEEGRQPIIINADSMQVYKELSIISARPSKEDEALVPHRLYGFVPVSAVYNTGRWLDDFSSVYDALDDNALPIIIGGTGLYFKALTEGFAVMPVVPDEIRISLRNRLEEEGVEQLHEALVKVDPVSASALAGRSIKDLQAEAQSKPLLKAARCRKIVALPERNVLYERINQRFDSMVEAGGLEEVKRIASFNLDPALPAMKAIGVPQLIKYLDGGWSLDEAIDNAKQESRRYAKRQMTWMRNQMDETWVRIDTVQ